MGLAMRQVAGDLVSSGLRVQALNTLSRVRLTIDGREEHFASISRVMRRENPLSLRQASWREP
jgi:hypothetical protein